MQQAPFLYPTNASDVPLYACRAWLIEAAREVPSSAKLEGFDISGANFPAQEWLPANVSMHVQDAFAELPEQLVGVYDVVHIRTIVSAVPKGDPGPLLKNLVQMLSM